MLDVNVDSQLVRTVPGSYRRTLLKKTEKEHKQKPWCKVIQGRSRTRADGEEKLVAVGLDEVRIFLGRWDHPPS